MPQRKVMTATDLTVACRLAVDAAEAAGERIRRGVGGEMGVRAKDASGDLVTDLDLAAEALIVDRIRARFPGHRILAAAAGLLGPDDDADGDAWSWLVDPLDGTNNVAIGLRACSVGIALCRDGLPMVGVVHDPFAGPTGQTYSAIRDRGARGPKGTALWCPPYRPAATGGVLAWVQGYEVDRADRTAQALRLALERRSRRLIQLWAPLLCWVMLARGDVDGFVGYRAGFVDLPAGSLIAREAGVRIFDFDGVPLDERTQLAGAVDFVAGPSAAMRDLMAMVWSAEGVGAPGIIG